MTAPHANERHLRLVPPLGRADSTAGNRSLIGRIIGQYRIASVLGRGGSGTVYLGERADKQYSAQVAIKIIDEGAAPSFGLRFRAERQILASLNHPNIAGLLDAGETEDHQPYLVMEYIHGEPVDQHCDEKQLELRARLELFLQVCGAVQYAHQNLIVHRDIKPANILVTGEAVPKLLDFGIAKLLDASDVTKPSDLTRMNDRLLTPEYASPEQILGKPVTTASDVYSLGVVLYQLLTGLRPYTLSSSSASQLELERAICVIDPMRPSSAVHAAKTAVPPEGEPSIATLAAARVTTPEKLERALTGDLDAIIMRALRKEPQLRYNSVEQMMVDIQSYLSNEPVHARQGNWVYYTNRFVRRNRFAVAAGASFVAFLIVISGMMSVQRAQTQAALEVATKEKRIAVQSSYFLRDLFAGAHPAANFGREITARELLDQGTYLIKDLPREAQAPVHESIGIAYRRLGESNKAVEQLHSAHDLRRELATRPDVPSLTTLIELAIAERDAGLLTQSADHFAQAQATMVSLGDTDPEARAKLLVETGRLETGIGRPAKALEAFNEALELMRQARGPRDPEVGSILSELANIYTWFDDGNLARAESLAREAVEIFRSGPVLHPDRVKGEFILAETLLYRGKIAEAAPLYEHTLVAQRALFKGSNAAVAETLASLAQVRLAQGDIAAAEKLVREAISIHHQANSKDQAKIGFLNTMLGRVLLKQSKFDEAEPLLRETLAILPADHPYVASVEHYLGEALAGREKLVDAEAHFRAAADHWKRHEAPEWRVARSVSALGEVMHKEGRSTDAEQYLVGSYRVLATAEGVDPETRDLAHARVVRFYLETGQRKKLETLMKEIHPQQAPDAKGQRAL